MEKVGPHGLYMDPATHPNLGDQILVFASVKLLEHFNKTIKYCAGQQTKSPPRLLGPCGSSDIMSYAKTAKDPFLFYHPGGNWGDIYRGTQKPRLDVIKFVKQFSSLTFVSGPQTLYYRDKSLAAADATFIKTYGGSPSKLYLAWRQTDSFEAALEMYHPAATVLRSPDAAFMLGPLRPCRENTVDVVVHLRTDDESVLRTIGAKKSGQFARLVCDAIIERGHTCRTVQWGDPVVYPTDKTQGMSSLLTSSYRQALGVVSLGRVVVTDRLHGFIMSYLSGR